LQSQGFAESNINTLPFLHLRYEGTDCALMVAADKHPANAESCKHGDFKAAFVERYLYSATKNQYGSYLILSYSDTSKSLDLFLKEDKLLWMICAFGALERQRLLLTLQLMQPRDLLL
jgi:hypothetical protein